MFMCVIVALLLVDPIYSAVPQVLSGEYVKLPRLAEVWQNGSIRLKCPPSEFSETSYSWYKSIEGTTEKQAVALNGRIEQVSGTLLITEANDEDAGRYLCVSNTSAGIESLETVLTVTIPLKASIEPQVQNIDIGKPAVFTCHVEGGPNVSISWWKDGVQIEHHGADLLIASVKIKDRGVYKCSVHNGYDLAEATAQLKLEGRYESPQILSAFGEKTLQPDSNVCLMCMASGNPTPEITWEVYGRRITNGDRVQVGQYVDDNGYAVSHLNMTSVYTNDGGVYKCSVTNELGSEEHTARINVYGLPYIRPMQNISIMAGDMLIVTCPVGGHPIESIKWERNNRSLPINQNQKVFSNGTLIIKKFESSSAQQTYVCIAKDPQGYSARASLNVHLLVPPQFEIKLQNQTGRLGDPAVLQCEAKGDKPLEILWNINGKRLELNIDNHYTMNTQIVQNGVKSDLRIERVERSDSALFTCVATNALGSDNTTINMVVQEVPGAPYDVKVMDKSGRSIELGWAAPYDGNSSIKQYQTEYKISEGSWGTDAERVSVSGQHNETSIIGLKPGTIYHLRILAVNEVGSSEPSETIRFITAAEAPSGPPTDVRLEAASSRALNVWWKSPKHSDWNEKILGYNVGHKLTDSDDAYIFQTAQFTGGFKKDNHLEISELKAYTPYSVIVRAFNKVGSGPSSKALTQYTAEDRPEKPPRDVTCMAVTSQRIRISWISPPLTAANGVIKGYKVIYGPSNSWDEENTKDTIISSSSKTFVDGLHKYTNYSIQVLAYTVAGDGVLSSPIQCQTEEDAPEKPANIKALIKSSSSVLVSWKPPAKPNGIVQQYTIYVNDVPDNDSQTTELSYKVQSPQTMYEVTELDQSKIYEFYVTASTYMGEGEPSLTLVQSPADQIPVRIASFDDILIITDQEDVKLPCVALGDPQPNVTWVMDGKLLLEDEHVCQLPDGSLQIKEATRKDAGKYSCYVDQFEQDSIEYKLMIPGPPHSPQVTVVAQTNTSLTLELRASHIDATPLLGYTIYYKSQAENWMTVNLTSPVEKYTLENLSCGSMYEVYVKGYNSIGTGDASDKLITTTKGSAPIQAEHDKFIKLLNNGFSLDLDTWSDGGCSISYFDIKYSTHGDADEMTSYKVKSGGRFEIMKLDFPTEYTIYVTAYNDAGHTSAKYNFNDDYSDY